MEKYLSKKDIEKKVFEIIYSAIECEKKSYLRLDSKLSKDLYADSLDLANIVIDIEDEFGITFSEDIQEKLLVSDVQFLVDMTEKLINKNNQGKK